MKTPVVVTSMLIIALVAGGGGYWIGRHHSEAGESEKDESASTQPAEEAKPVVDVQVAPLKIEAITETIAAYGTVTAQPGEVRVVSVPFEGRVAKLHVTAGQQVAAGDPLLTIEPSADTQIALQEAKNAAAAAEQELARTRQRFTDHLATNTELAQAQQALDSANLKLKSMTDRGVGDAKTLNADIAGVVGKIDVQEGQLIAVGGPLVEVTAGNRIEVSVGIEPADLPSLKVGQPAAIAPIGSSTTKPALKGQIRLISRRVDPATRLASVIVTLPPDANLMLDTFVTVSLTKASADAMVVPRDAVLPEEEGGYALFTADGNHAKKHAVQIGLENDKRTQVIADDLKAGDAVIVGGNFELEDGMQVKTSPATESASTATASSEPATAPAKTEAAP